MSVVSTVLGQGASSQLADSQTPGNSNRAHAGEATDRISGYAQSFPALGTLVHLRAFHASREQVEAAFAKAEQRVRTLEQVLTDYDRASETVRLTESALGRPVHVSSDLWDTLMASDRWYRESGGAFDSSLGALTRLWRKHRRIGRVPGKDAIQAARQSSGWQNVRLDQTSRTVQFTRPGICLDFGAIGKGHIVDAAFAVLLENGLECCLVDISGNIRCGSAPPGAKGWRIEIARFEKGGEPLRHVVLKSRAIATSGDLWQFNLVDGQRRSHILDPKTGVGVLGPIAATVIAPNARDADAMATAACVMEINESVPLAQKMNFHLLIARKSADNQTRIQETPSFPRDIRARHSAGE